jgi:hypothetical protein
MMKNDTPSGLVGHLVSMISSSLWGRLEPIICNQKKTLKGEPCRKLHCKILIA